MSSDANAGSQWERVAAELRACREAQQRAWGDIDNTTLGRYLADEVSGEEREQIESALDELPELRKLTELVRDVLGETEAVVAEQGAVLYGPAILPFSQAQALPAAARRPLPSEQSRTIGPARTWKQRIPASPYHQRAGLLAVAAVLLTLGVVLPRSGLSSSQSDSSLAMTRPMASADGLIIEMNGSGGEGGPILHRGEGGLPSDRKQQDYLLARIDASVHALAADGKQREAQLLARQYASNLTRQALFFQDKGDLAAPSRR